MIRCRSRAFLLLLACTLCLPLIASASAGPAVAQASVRPPLAEAMPADVQAFVSTDFDPESEQYRATTALAASLVFPGAGTTVASVLQQLAGFIGLIPDDTRTVLDGQIGIGMMGLEAAETGDLAELDDLGTVVDSNYAIVLHPNKAGAARDIVEEWFAQQVRARGVEPERSQAGQIVVLRNPDASMGSLPIAPTVVVFSGDYIFFGSDYVDMLPFVEATQGTVPVLADSADLERLGAALPTEMLIFGYLAGAALTHSVTGAFSMYSIASAIEPPIGTTAFAIVADEPGLRFEAVSLPVEGTAPNGVPAVASPDFAERVPYSTLAMFAGGDLGDSWLMTQVQKAILTALMGAMGGGEVDLSDEGLESQFGMLSMLTGIDFKTDLIDRLQGGYGAALFDIDAENALASSAVIASELDDVDRVSIAVTSLGPLLQTAAVGSVSVTTASVADQTVNNVTIVSGGPATTVQYGVVNDQLMLGLGDGLSVLAEEPVASLADDAEYQAALALLPAEYSSVIYVDVRAIARELAPYLIQSLAAGSRNPLAQCLFANTSTGTPIAADVPMDFTTGAICSVIGLVFGENSLQDFIVSRVPGPFAAVTYSADGLQHMSGILLV